MILSDLRGHFSWFLSKKISTAFFSCLWQEDDLTKDDIADDL